MMNLLTEPLPESVEIDGIIYPIVTDYRTSVAFEQLMYQEMPDEEKMTEALCLYYPEIPENIEEAVERILWFYMGGQSREENGDSNGSSKRIYDFEVDSTYIYAAFLDQYGIDLQAERIHWWKFLALFRSLKVDNEICKIMGYRSIDITADMTPEQKTFYRKMKKQYTICKTSTEESQKMTQINNILISGGDITNILK